MEKFIKNLFMVMILAAFSVSFTSCGGDDDDDEPATGSNLAAKIEGIYTGKLTYGTQTVEDAYMFSITRVTNTVVSVKADIFGTTDSGDSKSVRFNVVSKNGSYVLENEDYPSISMSVTGKNMFVTYLTTGGYMFSFNGSRD